MIGKLFGGLGVSLFAAAGATCALWAAAPFPVSVLDRHVLTPKLKPGQPLRVEILADRRARCDQDVDRFIHMSDGTRSVLSKDYPSSFGRLGKDAFVLEIPTSPTAPMGPAENYTVSKATCNPYQKLFGGVGSGDPWVDKFEFAPETVTVPPRNPDLLREEARLN